MLPEVFSMLNAKAQTQRFQKAVLAAQTRSQVHATRLGSLESRFSLFRLLGSIAVLALLGAFFSKWDASEKFLGVLGFVTLFFSTSFIHKRLQRRLQFWRGLVNSYLLSSARVDRNFAYLIEKKTPWHSSISAHIPPGHLYASDLDVQTSLFDLFDTCSTFEGSEKLFCAFLEEGNHPCGPTERLRRQNRLKAIACQTRLLRDLEVLRFDEPYMQHYLETHAEGKHDVKNKISSPNVPSRYLTLFRYWYSAVSVFAWVYFLVPAFVRFFQTSNLEALLSSLMAYSIFPILGLAVFHSLVESGNGLKGRSVMLSHVLPKLNILAKNKEFEEFSCTRENAQQRIQKLSLALDLVAIRGNPILWFFIHLLIPYDALCCVFLTFEMGKTAPRIETWWADVVEFDFLCALARFAVENPTCRFLAEPEASRLENNNLETAGKVDFSGEDVGHPLIAAHKRITNTFNFKKNAPLVLLTGSNMAGKSTFLRTLGINTLLANMGAPVCAARFSALGNRILCAIRVDDSLFDGTSYFYAEVKRLHLILEQIKNGPALFLVDEIFRGTNNRERFLGSWHLLRALLATGSYGVVSTHDLALTQLAEHDGRLRNMHFREQVEHGKLVFDYLLRDGACPTTNALHIMRAEGLPIPEHPEVLGV